MRILVIKFRCWLGARLMIMALHLMGDSRARRLLQWHMDQCAAQLETWNNEHES